MRSKDDDAMETYLLERLDDFLHVDKLTIIGFEGEIDIYPSDLVHRHLPSFRRTQKSSETSRSDPIRSAPPIAIARKP